VHVGEIADDVGGGKGGAVDTDHLMPAGKSAENRTADPT